MNKSQQLHIKNHSQSFNSISLAFRKLLDRVASAQVRSQSHTNNTKRSSIGSLVPENLPKKRKSSLRPSIRKNSFYSHNIFDSSKRSKTQIDNKQKNTLKSTNPFNLSFCKDRSKSNPSLSNSTAIYSKINQYNGLLITKTFLFEEGAPYGTTPYKRALKSPFRKHPSHNEKREGFLANEQNLPYQSRIKANQKRIKLQHKFKNIQELKCKNKFFRMGDFEPWETEKGEEYCFIDE